MRRVRVLRSVSGAIVFSRGWFSNWFDIATGSWIVIEKWIVVEKWMVVDKLVAAVVYIVLGECARVRKECGLSGLPSSYHPLPSAKKLQSSITSTSLIHTWIPNAFGRLTLGHSKVVVTVNEVSKSLSSSTSRPVIITSIPR